MGSVGCPVSSWTMDTVNGSGRDLADVARHDLIDEPFDHGLSHESRFSGLHFGKCWMYSKLGDPVYFRIQVLSYKFSAVKAVAIPITSK